MNARHALLAILGLLFGGAVAWFATYPLQDTTVVQTKVSGEALVGGPFTLTDQTGKRVTDQDYRGRYMLVFFGFTNCPDICPAGLQVLSAALDKLGPKAESVTPVFITLDAKRDTPEKLGQYVKSFHPKLVGLTGSEEEVAAAAKAYRVYAQKVVDEKNPGSYSYDHSALFYLMGPDGKFVAPIPHTNDVSEVVAALEKVL